jgi:hypothetical protein
LLVACACPVTLGLVLLIEQPPAGYSSNRRRCWCLRRSNGQQPHCRRLGEKKLDVQTAASADPAGVHVPRMKYSLPAARPHRTIIRHVACTCLRVAPPCMPIDQHLRACAVLCCAVLRCAALCCSLQCCASRNAHMVGNTKTQQRVAAPSNQRDRSGQGWHTTCGY